MDSFDNIPIWTGTPGQVSGSTSFGWFDSDAEFTANASKFATYATRKLGYPIVNIELVSENIYACYEEAVIEYSKQVNEFNIINNLLEVQGAPLTTPNLTHHNIASSLSQIVRISKTYGLEAGSGGDIDLKSGSIDVVPDQQYYDIQSLYADVSESGKRIDIRRVFHYGPPAVNKYFDPFAGNSAGVQGLMDEFGWGDMGIAMPFTMLPMFGDLLRIQAIELNDQVRKSNYGFELIPVNKIRVFPMPDYPYTLWFQYTLAEDQQNPIKDSWDNDGSGSITDMSNVPYELMEYTDINSVGRRWITAYAFALVKETLGYIRSKYSTIPIPGDDTSLDGDSLRSEGAADRDDLITQLRESLDKTSKEAMLERKSNEADMINNTLAKVPLQFYIG